MPDEIQEATSPDPRSPTTPWTSLLSFADKVIAGKYGSDSYLWQCERCGIEVRFFLAARRSWEIRTISGSLLSCFAPGRP
jgi:hypothetical protein